jgi:hypothetical protein
MNDCYQPQDQRAGPRQIRESDEAYVAGREERREDEAAVGMLAGYSQVVVRHGDTRSYVERMRPLVGVQPLVVAAAGVLVWDEQGRVLLQCHVA